MNRKLSIILLALFLLVYGLLAVSNIRFELQNFVMGILAIGAGVLLLLDR